MTCPGAVRESHLFIKLVTLLKAVSGTLLTERYAAVVAKREDKMDRKICIDTNESTSLVMTMVVVLVFERCFSIFKASIVIGYRMKAPFAT